VVTLFWSRITENGSQRAWHCTHNGGAEFATRFDSCSHCFAELIVLLPETHRSVHAAFLRNLFAPILHECPPIAQSTSRRSLRSSLGLAESASHPRKCKLELPARSSRSSNVGAFAAGTAKRTGDFVPVLDFEQRNKPTVHSPLSPQTDLVHGGDGTTSVKESKHCAEALCLLAGKTRYALYYKTFRASRFPCRQALRSYWKNGDVKPLRDYDHERREI
jgi:hypothetical protein